MNGTSVFTYPTTIRFIKGLFNIFPPVLKPTSSWDLNLVLCTLTKPPLELLAIFYFTHLSMKVTFLVAITSAKQVSELAAMMADTHHTIFYKDKESLQLYPKFLPKVVSGFCLNLCIHILIFHPKPHASSTDRALHSLNIRRALAFYLHRI